jgi:radical SAM superfamily enzyme YgiQ (UPF0313 family)
MARIDPEEPFTTTIRPRPLPRAMRVPPALVAPAVRPRIARRHALLINPFYPKDPHASFGKHVLTPTLALTTVASVTPSSWTVALFDENLLRGAPPCDPVPEVVGITVHLTFAARAFELARHYRALGATVVLGGLHVISSPDECAPHADALAVGDGVAVWARILEDVEHERLAPRYHADFDGKYADDPAPRRDLLPRDGFLTTTSVNATRGCHNRCGFCYLATDGLRMPYRMRDPTQIAKELALDGQPYAVFTDNNLGSNRRYLRELSQALEGTGKIWSAAITIDVTDDPSLVRAMALGGCTGVFVGFESLTDENLRDAKKKTPRADDYARRVRILHDHGIQVNGSFVLGFDHDRKDVFAELAEWVEDQALESATFHILTPYPGTPLFRQLESEGRILHRDWSKYDTAHVVFRPKHMSEEELARGYAWLYQRLFSRESIWARRPSDPSAVLPYLGMSYLYKRSNPLWYFLIRARLQHAVWAPLVEATRRRHLKFRELLRARPELEVDRAPRRALTVVSAGV